MKSSVTRALPRAPPPRQRSVKGDELGLSAALGLLHRGGRRLGLLLLGGPSSRCHLEQTRWLR